jgi:hypothetical protein
MGVAVGVGVPNKKYDITTPSSSHSAVAVISAKDIDGFCPAGVETSATDCAVGVTVSVGLGLGDGLSTARATVRRGAGLLLPPPPEQALMLNAVKIRLKKITRRITHTLLSQSPSLYKVSAHLMKWHSAYFADDDYHIYRVMR